MTQNKQIYKCEVCGNIIEVLHQAGGTLVCCGKPMKLMKENSEEASAEKHIPVVSVVNGGVVVKIGEVEHPMVENHYIEWVEVITPNKVYRREFKPGEKPETEFRLDEEVIIAREYCNVHGLWRG